MKSQSLCATAVAPADLLGTLVHEMIHAAGVRGHRRNFAQAGRQCELSGRPTGMAFKDAVPEYARGDHRQVGTIPSPEPAG